jgi:hypothetical protein
MTGARRHTPFHHYTVQHADVGKPLFVTFGCRCKTCRWRILLDCIRHLRLPSRLGYYGQPNTHQWPPREQRDRVPRPPSP